jgi:hypothetical protein
MNMLRQVGLAIGVSVFVAVLGTPNSPHASLSAFQHGWTVIAVIAALAALVGAIGLRNPSGSVAPAPVPAGPAGLTVE